MKSRPPEKQPNNPSADDSNFVKVLAALGIQASALPTQLLSTSAANHVLTTDAETSLLTPFPVKFQDAAQRDAYLTLAGIDPASRPDFPLELTAFAANDLTVTTDNPLLIQAAAGQTPVALNVDRLTLQTGAQIQSVSSLVATVQVFTKQ